MEVRERDFAAAVNRTTNAALPVLLLENTPFLLKKSEVFCSLHRSPRTCQVEGKRKGKRKKAKEGWPLAFISSASLVLSIIVIPTSPSKKPDKPTQHFRVKGCVWAEN